MRNYLLFVIMVSSLLVPAPALSNAGPPIPKPRISIVEACTAAMDYFHSKETRLSDQELAKPQEYIIFSAIYTNEFPDNPQHQWAWKIVFVHPVFNDHSIVYKVDGGGKVVFLHATE